jgi:hypothetical protein
MFLLTCLSLCPPVCFPGLQVAWLGVFFFKMLKPLQLALPVTDGLVGHVYHTHHIKPIYRVCVKHCQNFSFVFSAPLPASRNLFSESGIFCGGRYQPDCTGIFWPAEGTSQPVTISKKWKNPSSALHRRRARVQALLWFEMCALGTGRKSRKGLLLYVRTQKSDSC